MNVMHTYLVTGEQNNGYTIHDCMVCNIDYYFTKVGLMEMFYIVMIFLAFPALVIKVLKELIAEPYCVLGAVFVSAFLSVVWPFTFIFITYYIAFKELEDHFTGL